jgi:phenylalanyl-tRNA synthetase alpha subunit
MQDTFLASDKPIFLAYIIDDVRLGQAFPRHAWPLHVSFVPWFESERRAELDAELERVLSITPAFSVTVGGEELFGETKHAKVNVIEPTPQIMNLHLLLLEKVEEFGRVISDQQYLREHYRAHITHYFERHKAPGEVLSIDAIYLAELTDDDHCTPLKRYDLRV